MKFNIYTFGCKVNQYESFMMKEQLLHHNFSYTKNMEEADIIIVNTCTVTNTSDQKCLKYIRRLRKKYPSKILAVVGCSVQNDATKYEDIDIDILLGNKKKNEIASFIADYINNSKKTKYIDENRNSEFEDMFIDDYDKTRAFIKIEDGCDNFCAYCIIPYVRGKVRSKDYDKVLAEAKCLSENHQEIILTGIHTGHYMDSNHDLSDLINDLANIDTIKRIRISSIEITELNDKFMEMLRNNPKVVDHLHIPLQAGSDKILKLMNRKYDLDYFFKQVAKIRSIRPNISLTTDIIVGFPGETEDDFNDTLRTAEKINFSKIHVFPFSPRKGTVAASMDNQVSEIEKKERVKKLIALSDKLEANYYDKFIGKKVDVLIEKYEDGYSYGHTGNYLEVKLKEKLEIGKIYTRKL